MKQNIKVGKLHSFKNRKIFIATIDNDKCPRVSMAKHGRNATFRDDYHGELKMDKIIAKLIFKE